jgi:CheY-like chemotaxis protein
MLLPMSHRVLVVDDDPDIRETVIEVLEEHGHAAVGAANGNEALVHLRASSDQPCLILLDLMMPVMDGRAFREEQMKDPALSPIPVVVISAFRDVLETASQMNVAAHMKKPISLADLVSLVERYCVLPTTA